MGRSRRDEWEEDFEVYSEAQVESVLEAIGVDIEYDTDTHFIGYCPFHGNSHTPAFAVKKTNGLYICFNPSCAASGNLEWLVRQVSGKNVFEAKRLITKHAGTLMSVSEFRQKRAKSVEQYPEFDLRHIEKMAERLWTPEGETGLEYMRARHFEDDTLKEFQVGYIGDNPKPQKRNLITVPMFDPTGRPIGIIGREASFSSKRFWNSKGLPKSKTMFNMHRARKHTTLIVVEASFSAMRVTQAGYPNVAGALGGFISTAQFDEMNRYFDTVIIMTDNDKLRFEQHCYKCKKAGEPMCLGHNDGRELGWQIANGFRGRTKWAVWNDQEIYPNGAKDPDDLTDEDIRKVIKNTVSTMEYRLTFEA